jgi:hypothetical protein
MMEQGLLSRARRGRPLGTARPRPAGVLARLLLWALVLVFPLTLLLGMAGPAHADSADDVDMDTLSFYRLSSSMTALFSTAQEPASGTNLGEGWDTLLGNPASAGSMLGYADDNFNPISGWLTSSLAMSSDSVGYDTLDGTADAGLSGVRGAREYALFGATLNGLGLDSTSTGLSLGFFNTIAGGIVFILYTAAAAVDALWSILISALIWLNPFKLFYGAVYVLSPDFANGMTGGEGPPGIFGSIAEWIGSWYLVLVELSWTVMVPLFIGVFLLSIVMFKKFDKGSGLKKLCIRLLFIGLGLPLLGSMYTGTLNAMDYASDQGNAGSTRVVLSTFVDFESWAMEHRLRVPDQTNGVFIEWDGRQNAPSGRSQASVRDLALLINAQVLGMEGEVDPLGTSTDGSWSESALAGDESVFTKTDYDQVADILRRYMSNAHVTASSFENRSKSTLSEDLRASCGEDDEACWNARDWFNDYIGDPDEVAVIEEGDVQVANNPLISVAEGSGLRVYRDRGGDMSFFTEPGTGSCGVRLSSDNGSPEACNLAPLAMYNYLNTDFGPTSYTSYSSGNATSEATRSIHNSVSMVGTGTMSFVYWANAVVLLGAFVTIGFGYAIAMVIGNIRRSFQLMTAIPFATLGAMAGIAKVIVYSIAMIMEVLITLFLYKFVQEFLLSIPSIIEVPFSQALNNDEYGDGAAIIAFLVAGGFVTMVVTLVSIIVVILFTIMAMRLRKTLIKAVEEASTKLVEKLTDSQIAPPGGGGGGMLPAMAGAGAAGAGSALANRLMGGGGPKGGGKGPNAGGTNGAGPEGISTRTANSAETNIGGDANGTQEVTPELPGNDDGDGNKGQPGPGLEPGDQSGEAEQQVLLGEEVEAKGLSNEPGSENDDTQPRDPQVGDGSDPMEVAATSAQESADAYGQADAKKVDATKDGAKAGVHAAFAATHAATGNAPEATKSAGNALESAGSSKENNAKAEEYKKQAETSSLDDQTPDPKLQQRKEQGRQMQQVGNTASNVAGVAGGTGGTPDGGSAMPGGSTPSGKGNGKNPSGPPE